MRILNNNNEKRKRIYLRRNETPEEKIVWSFLRNRNLGMKWKRQVSIGKYITDFYCREKLLVIELDGMHHMHNREYDLRREKYFSSLGIQTIRFQNHEVRTTIEQFKGELFRKIKELPLSFQERGWG